LYIYYNRDLRVVLKPDSVLNEVDDRYLSVLN